MSDQPKVSKPFCLDCAKLEMKIFQLELQILHLQKDIEDRDQDIRNMRFDLKIAGQVIQDNDIPSSILSQYVTKDERSKGCLQVVN